MVLLLTVFSLGFGLFSSSIGVLRVGLGVRVEVGFGGHFELMRYSRLHLVGRTSWVFWFR